MEFYKPSLRLSFVYNHFTDKVYLKSTMTVYMPEEESLASLPLTYDPATKSGSQVYTHVVDRAQFEPYLFEHISLVEILGAVNAPYTPNDLAGFKAALQNELAPLYTFEVIVDENPNVQDSSGRSGGSISNTNGEVDLI